MNRFVPLILLLLALPAWASDPVLSLSGDYRYANHLSQKNITIPFSPVVPVVEGFHINRAQFKTFDRLKLAYLLPDGSRVRETYEGRLWEISQKRPNPQKQDKATRNSARQALLSTYKTALSEAGATLYQSRTQSGSRVIFNLGTVWGVFTAYPAGLDLKAVDVGAFVQTLFIDPETLLAELESHGEVRLDGLYFDTGKASLKPDSRPALLAATALLQKYPDLVLAVEGHTDSVGKDSDNQRLSEQRAAAVKTALVSEGIDQARLQSRGFGEQSPVASNDSAQGRTANRRVMLKKVSGSTKRAMISIDFMKPVPGFTRQITRGLENESLRLRINQQGLRDSRQISGIEMRAEYRTVDKMDRRFSALEILNNYEAVLTAFGARIVGKDFPAARNIYFNIEDRGDGQSIYGVVKAYDSGSYTIRFLLSE